ncbi:MAG: lysophospholipid acyltransferase family protein [Actinomycetota bacterium]
MTGRGRQFDFWWQVGLLTLAPLYRLLFPLRFDGLDRIPVSGAAILAPNHVSVLDPIAVALATSARGRPLRFLAAAEFFAHPLWGWGLRRMKGIPVRRGTRDLGALDQLQQVLHSGGLAGIFPEGRVGPGDFPLRGRSGLVRAAVAAGVPILPIGVWGTQDRWPLGGPRLSLPLRIPVAVVMGECIHVPEEATRSTGVLREVTREVMRSIESQVLRARAIAGLRRRSSRR